MSTRFVLLRHEVPDDFGRPSHWDLLLERETGCWTWAIEQLPGRLTGEEEPATVEATRLPDHRKHYLEYEGPVSDDRGMVRRELEGQCEWIHVSDHRIQVRLEFVYDAVPLVLEATDDDQWQITVQ